MQFEYYLLFLFQFFSIITIAVLVSRESSSTQDIEIPRVSDSIADHPIWTRIHEIGKTSANKDADIMKAIKGTFLDPDVIATTHSSSNPIAQDINCDTSPQSPLYSDALYLVSITINLSDEDIFNPGSACTEHASWNSAHFGICTFTPQGVRMSWKVLGTWAYWVTTSCVQYHSNMVSGGRYIWREGRDVRVY
ncbi:hypothetical protein HOY80DRAFT_981609 [Tuber brumale]|nr:hypothetical protein HOY80DRAFT_981609 [Tuber brumale]